MKEMTTRKFVLALAMFSLLSGRAALAGEPEVAMSIHPDQVKKLTDKTLGALLEASLEVALDVPTKANQGAYLALQRAVQERAGKAAENSLATQFDGKRYAECREAASPAVQLLRIASENGQSIELAASPGAVVQPPVATLAMFARPVWDYWFPDHRAITTENFGELVTFLIGYCYSNRDLTK